MSDDSQARRIPMQVITDPARIAALQHGHAAAQADALVAGQCAHPSNAFGEVCLLPPGHVGRHQGRAFWWDEEGPVHGLESGRVDV